MMSETTLKSWVIEVFETNIDDEYVYLTEEEIDEIVNELYGCYDIEEIIEKEIVTKLQLKGYEYNKEECVWELPEEETEVEEVHKSDLRLLIESMYDTDKLERLRRKIDKRLAEIKDEIVNFIWEEKRINIKYFENDPRFILSKLDHRLIIEPKIRRNHIEVILTFGYDKFSFYEYITQESQIDEEFDRWVIRQTLDYMTKELI